MMSNAFILPSYFGTPIPTEIAASRYDSKGRQLSFVETEVQRLERMALVNASKARNSSPNERIHSPSPPRMKNVLAEEFLFDDSSYLSNEVQIIHSPPNLFLVPTSRKSSSSSSNFEADYKRKRRSLSSIREED